MNTRKRLLRHLISLCFAIALVAALRWPLRTTYLFGFDNVNFALALDDFNPAQHQPQPPGYPLFVLLVWLLRPICHSPQVAQLWAGFIGSGIAVSLAYEVGLAMFGWRQGLAAALLLLLHPAFWLAGVGNSVRTFLAVGSLGLGLCCWNGIQRSSAQWFVAACVALGVAAGFRPELLVYLTPLLVFTLWKARISSRAVLLGLVGLFLAVAAWLAAIALAVHGISSTLTLMGDYLHAHSPGSLVYGGSQADALQRARMALAWNTQAAVVWLWALPIAFPRLQDAYRGKIAFLTWWLLPGLLFHLIVHQDHPDQGLAVIACLCVIGGGVLGSIRKGGWLITTGLAASVSAYLFFHSLPRMPHSGNYYRLIADQEQRTAPAIRRLQQLRSAGPLAVVCWDCVWPNWRQISYYLPNTSIYVLHAPSKGGNAGVEAWHLINQRQVSAPLRDSIAIPPGTTVAWLISEEVRQTLSALPVGIQWRSPVPVVRIEGQTVRLGPYSIHAQQVESNCSKRD